MVQIKKLDFWKMMIIIIIIFVNKSLKYFILHVIWDDYQIQHSKDAHPLSDWGPKKNKLQNNVH